MLAKFQSCPTLCESMGYIPSESSVHGILQARILEWVVMTSSRESSQPRGLTLYLLQFLHYKWILFFFFFYFILLYNTVLILPYIDTNLPRVYTSSQSWITLPPPTPHHLSGSSPCTSPKHPVSCIEHRLALRFLHDSIHVSMPFSQSSHPLHLPQSPKVRSIHLCLFCCLAYRVIITIFLNSIYMC